MLRWYFPFYLRSLYLHLRSRPFTGQPPASHEQGYTLLSTLIAMALISTVSVIGMMSYQHQWENTQLTAAENRLIALVAEGALHARQLNETFILTDSQVPEGFSDWQQGIALRTTARSVPLLIGHWPTHITVSGPAHRLFLLPRAFDSTINGTFTLCAPSGRGRKVVFNRTGVPHHEDTTAQDCQYRSPRQSLTSTG